MPACFARFDAAGDMDGAGIHQQFLGQGGFARIRVRNDGESTAARYFVLNAHIDLNRVPVDIDNNAWCGSC